MTTVLEISTACGINARILVQELVHKMLFAKCTITFQCALAHLVFLAMHLYFAQKLKVFQHPLRSYKF